MKGIGRGRLPSLVIVLLMGACGGEPDAPDIPAATSDVAMSPPAWVSELAEMANAIEAAPASADSILSAHDMARATFDSLVYEVAADPTLSAAFEALRR